MHSLGERLMICKLLPIALLALMTSGCSLLVNFDECTQDADCPDGSCQAGLCAGQPACSRRSDCTSQGADAYCLSGLCRVIDPARCDRLSDAFEQDTNIIPIGALMPLTGANGDRGVGTIAGAELALSDINKAGGAQGTPFGLITCDTLYEPSVASQKAAYLRDTLGIRAIVGGFSSGETIAIANDVAIPGDVLTISPASTSPALTNLNDDGLLWRTIASDSQQAPAMGQLIKNLGLTRVALLSVDSLYGDGFRSALLNYWASEDPTLINDNTRYTSARFPDTVDYSPMFIEGLAAPLFGPQGLKPQAIIVIGSGNAQGIISTMEQAYVSTLPEAQRPIWVLGEALKSSELLTRTEDFAQAWDRLMGTQIVPVQSALYTIFKNSYLEATGLNAESYIFADKAHDAAYLIALAIAVQPNPLRITGSELAAVLQRLTMGQAISADQSGFTRAVTALSRGESINLNGVSGGLDFDLATGDVFSTVSGWSIEQTQASPPQAQFVDGDILVNVQ